MMAAVKIPPQHAQEPDSLTLQAARFAVASDILASERRELPAKITNRLQSFLREIDETILPRNFDILRDDKPVARMVIENQCLVGLELPAGKSVLVRSGDVPRAIADILRISGQISIIAQGRPTENYTPKTSFTSTRLKSAMEVTPDGTPFDFFVQVMHPLAIAQLTCTQADPTAKFQGDTTWQELLTTYVQGYRFPKVAKQGTVRFEPRETEGVMVPLGPDHVLIMASLGHETQAVVTDRTKGIKALDRWQMLCDMATR